MIVTPLNALWNRAIINEEKLLCKEIEAMEHRMGPPQLDQLLDAMSRTITAIPNVTDHQLDIGGNAHGESFG